MTACLRYLGTLQALCILLAAHPSQQVPLMRNPSLAGTFVALTLFSWPGVLVGLPAVLATTRHMPSIVLAVCGLTYSWRGDGQANDPLGRRL